jgi:hypothetical protein
MMNSTIIQDEDTARGWVGVHDRQYTLKPFHELITIITPNLDVTVDDAIYGECWKHGVTKVMVNELEIKFIQSRKTTPHPTDKVALFPCSEAMNRPSI